MCGYPFIGCFGPVLQLEMVLVGFWFSKDCRVYTIVLRGQRCYNDFKEVGWLGWISYGTVLEVVAGRWGGYFCPLRVDNCIGFDFHRGSRGLFF